MRGESDDGVTLVANGILAAIAKEATLKNLSGPFSLDDLLHAWLEHDASTVATLPDPPGSVDSSMSQRRTYWFYEGCQALEEGAYIAEVGDGKFVVAQLKNLMAEMHSSESVHRD
jgi:hypothetical protein